MSDAGQATTALSVEVSRDGGTTVIALSGFIDAGAPLTAIAEATGSPLVLDLAGVRRISSFGVSAFMDALRDVPTETSIVWRRVSVPLMLQVSMIENFNGRASIESFHAPYYCAACGHEQHCLLEVEAVKAAPAPYRAPAVA